jgi:ABC-2 type transport system ATP-binding protein
MIRVSQLTKDFVTYKTREGMLGAIAGLFHRRRSVTRAVDQMEFAIDVGEMVGYIGPNGAGKSTTIKMLTGILRPTSGDIEVAGFVPAVDRQRYVRHIGVVFGQRTQLWWDLAVVESFNLLGRIYEIPKSTFHRRMGELTDLLGLEEFLDTPVRKLSLGQRMRCDLAASLLHRPRILFLDEPSIGLDVLGKARMREFLRDINQRERVTVLLTTHDLNEMEKLCSRIILIDHGRKLFDGDLSELVDRYVPQRRIIAEVESIPGQETREYLGSIGIETRDGDAGRVEFSYSRKDMPATKAIEALMSRVPIRDLRLEEPGIESVIHEMDARHELRQQVAIPVGA